MRHFSSSAKGQALGQHMRGHREVRGHEWGQGPKINGTKELGAKELS